MSSDVMDTSDETLLQRIVSGDQRAATLLYHRHSGALLGFLRSRMTDHSGALDVLQETFLEVWRGAARFDGRSNVRTWIFGIARNRSVDRMRRQMREVVSEPDETVADGAPGPEALAEAKCRAEEVRRCVRSLGAAHRRALELAFFEDLDYPEIARREGIPLGTVKSRIRHAKQLLLRRLAARPIAPRSEETPRKAA